MLSCTIASLNKYLRDYLPKDQFMIVFGTALPNKQYYKEIHNFYSVVEEYKRMRL